MQRPSFVACAVSIAVLLGTAAAASARPLRLNRSTPVSLTQNGRMLLNVNPESDSVTLFKVQGNGLRVLREIAVGDEPVSVAVHPRGAKAYVANAADGTVTVLDLRRKRVKTTIAVGAEPRAVVLTPNGKRLYVACASDETIVEVDTRNNAVLDRVTVVPYGTGPRALAVTDDGDRSDTDERVFASLFFARVRTGKSSAEEGQDDQREGAVFGFSTNPALGRSVTVAQLGPLANAGFSSNGRLAPAVGTAPAIPPTNPATFTAPTGAFPNQLAAVAIRPRTGLGYVVSTGASPNGPVRFDTNAQGLVSVFETVTQNEVTAGQTDPDQRRSAPLNLNQGVDLVSGAARLFHTNPVAMAWRPNGSDAWIVVQSSDLVVRLTVDANGIPTIGAPLVQDPGRIVRVDLQSDNSLRGLPAHAPRGIAIDKRGRLAYVANFVTRSVSVIDIKAPTAPALVGNHASSALPAVGSPDHEVLTGAGLFFTSRGTNGRMSSEGWGSCGTCHPDGRSDGVTWMFDGGPRQTIALDGTFSRADPFDQRILNWSATRDEIHDFELNARNVSGGRGLVDDDRLFFAIGGTAGLTPTEIGPTEQFHQVDGTVGTTNGFRGGTLPDLLAGMLGPRRDFGTATLPDGRIFIIGGRMGPGLGALVSVADAVLEFDPRTNMVTRKSTTNFNVRHSLGVAAVRTSGGPRIYAIGGYLNTMPTVTPTQLVEEYDPAADTWRPVGILPVPVAQFAITVSGGINTAEPSELIHVIGGNTASEFFPSLTNATPWQQFLASPTGPGTWTGLNPAGLTARRLAGAATVIRGVQSRVFVMGGMNALGAVLPTVEEFQAQTAVAVGTTVTQLPAPRASFGIASSLATSRIYVIGGIDATLADQTSILEFSAATNGPVPGPAGTPSGTWAARGNLAFARRGLQVPQTVDVTNLLPYATGGREKRHEPIVSWVRANVRSARGSTTPDPATVEAGRAMFGTPGIVVPGFSCATCHGGPKWTRSRVDWNPPPSPEIGLGLGNERVIGSEIRQTITQGANVLIDAGTFTLGRLNVVRPNPADVSQTIAALGANGFNIPSLLSVHETAPYFHSGLAHSLTEVLDGSHDGNGGTRYHLVTDPSQRAQIEAFLRTIDATTTPFP